MKDMVSTVRTSRERPSWIDNTLWRKMTEHWDTEEAKYKSSKTSANRMSDRGGLGAHVHVSGQKAFTQVEQDMIIELGRPVTLAEVFIRTHTKKDGTFVDRKAETVAERFNRIKKTRETELATQSSPSSDGTSPPKKLSLEEENELFLKATYVNERGEAYGVGNLSQSLNNKRKSTTDSSYNTLQDQLAEAQRCIGEQASVNAKLKEEVIKLSKIEQYLKKTDPAYLDFLAAADDETESTAADPQTSENTLLE